MTDAFRKVYLGDGVYVETDGNDYVLTTDRSLECPDCGSKGASITHVIVLEPDMVDGLVQYVTRASVQAARLRAERDK